MEENKSMTREELKPFLESGRCWDEVTFEFDDGKKLYVSQNFLSLASPVFQAMFESDFEEKKTKTVKLVGKEFDDMLELLHCLHPNIQKPITFDNVLAVSSVAEEYQCCLIIDRCKETMLAYLKSEIELANETNIPVDNYQHALTCLKLLIEAVKLNYDNLITDAVDTITRFNFEYFTGMFNARIKQIPTGFGLFNHAIARPAVTAKGQSNIAPKCRAEDVANDCKILYDNLSENMKNKLLVKRLCKSDQRDII